MIWRLGLGVGVSGVCLYLVLRQVDFAQLWLLVQGLNPVYPLAVSAVLFFSFWIRGWRWALLLGPVGRPGQGGLYLANLVGFGANNLLPARLGELVRALACRRFTGIAATSALATVVLERVLDGMVLLGVLFWAVMSLEPGAQAGAFTVEALKGAGWTLLAVYLGVVALLAGLWRWPGTTVRLVGGLARRVAPSRAHKVEDSLMSFHQGLAAVSRGGSLAAVVGYSLLLWAVFSLNFMVFLPAVGLEPSMRLALFVMAGGALGTLVPAGPGYVGTMQLAVAWALMLAGAPEQKAMAYGLLIWAAHYLPITAAGLAVIWIKGLSLKNLRHESQELAR